jgi:hypothetical protein
LVCLVSIMMIITGFFAELLLVYLMKPNQLYRLYSGKRVTAY